MPWLCLERHRPARGRGVAASHLCGRDAASFFVTRTGNPLDGADVRRTFYSLSRQVGLRGQDDSHGPRLHDFRHNSESRIIPSSASVFVGKPCHCLTSARSGA